jgi:hypothetical protein
MLMQEYDRSSKWLIQHHSDPILRLAGIRDIDSWRPLQAELVQPRQLPDGLIEARLAGRDLPALSILEVATFPDARVIKQVTRDAALVFLDRDVRPEVLVLFLPEFKSIDDDLLGYLVELAATCPSLEYLRKQLSR